MSTHITPETTSETPRKTPFYKKRIVKYPAIALVAFTVGAASSGSNTETITKTVPGPTKTVTVTDTKVETRVPTSCTDALRAADTGFGLAGDAFGVVSDILDSVQQMDEDGISAGTEKIVDYGNQLKPVGSEYRMKRDACIASAN